MLLTNKRKTKVLNSLGGCPGWSAPLLFANTEDRFSRDEPLLTNDIIKQKIVNEYDQEIPQSQTADNPVAP